MYGRVIESAERVNNASDDMADAIREIDEVLKKRRIGVQSWVAMAANQTTPLLYLGYTKMDHGWGLAIRVGTDGTPWWFNDAPRPYRVVVAPLIPTLLVQLATDADELADKMVDTAAQIRQWAKAIEEVPRG